MDHRHHRASRDVQVIIVPVPFESGSPAPLKWAKPSKYPFTQREAWRPATKPPNRKAEATRRLLDGIRHNDEAAREFMAEARRRTA
jgi:hypothetical protein